MRKAIIALILLLLPISAAAQLSPNTQHMYSRHVASLTGVSDDSNKIPIEIPSWATGALLLAYVQNCSSCDAYLSLKLYYPGQTTFEISLYPSIVSLSGNNWFGGAVLDLESASGASFTIKKGPLVPGTNILFVNWNAGTFDVEIWIRYYH